MFATGATPSPFRECDRTDDRGHRHEANLRSACREKQSARREGEEESQSPGSCQLVVGLPYSLTPEVRGGRRKSPYVEVGNACLSPTRNGERSNQLEVLEQHVGVIAAGGDER